MELLRNYCPDLLFLDLDMPHKNSLECLVEMRGIPALSKLSKIIFSSTTRASNIQTAYKMGAHLFVTKRNTYSEQCYALEAIMKLQWGDPEAVKEQYCVNNRYVTFL